MGDVKGRLPTKRIDMFKDHEFVVGKLVLGVTEKMADYGVLLGAGLWNDPVVNAQADHHFINFHCKSMATSGGSRLLYLELIGGAAGCSLRGMSSTIKVDNAIALTQANPVRGSLRFGTAGSKCTGEAHGVCGQLRIPDRAMDAGGYYSGVYAEIYCDGNNSDPAPTQGYGVLRLQVHGGNQAARRKVKTAILIQGETGSKASKYLLSNADVGDGGDGGIQVNINGTAMWIPLWNIA